jgi:hypothetical protein
MTRPGSSSDDRSANDRLRTPSGGGLPLVLRCVLICVVTAGVLGGAVGLVVGLDANPATAWFAVFELGVPAAFLGAWVGLVFAGVTSLARDGMRGHDDEAGRASRRLDAGVAVAVLLGAGAELSALELMDWASRSDSVGTATFGNGPVPLLVAATLLSVAVAVLLTVAGWRWLRVLLVATTLITAASVIAVALSRISAANSSYSVGPTVTSYEPGSAVGILAACAMVAAGTIGLVASYAPRPIYVSTQPQ